MILLAFIICAAFFPSVLYAIAMQWWDRSEPEPRKLLVALFLWGMGAGVVIGIIEIVLRVLAASSGAVPSIDSLSSSDGIILLLVVAVILAAVRELIKYAFLAWRTARAQEMTQAVDGVIYGTTLGWGTALIQNMFMIMTILLASSFDVQNQPRLFFLLIFQTLMTGICSGYAGFAISSSRLFAGNARMVRVRGVAEAITLHAAFLFLVFLQEPRLAGGVVLLAAIYLFSRFALSRNTQIMRRQLSTS